MYTYDGFMLMFGRKQHNTAKQKIQVLSLGWEDPLEKGMKTHSSILAWRIQQTEELGRLQFKGCRVGHDCSRHIRLMIKYKNLPKRRLYTILYKI